MQMPTVSIVIPCFNAADTLEKAVDSVLRDGYPDIEILIIDDGSSDDSLTVAGRLAAQDARIRVEHQDNRGVSAARNKGIALASGALVAFLDADDYYLDDSLSRRLENLLAHDEDSLIGTFCPAIMVNDVGEQLFEFALFDYRLPDGRLYYTSTFGSAFNPSCVLIKKDKLTSVGGFDETLSGGEDYELWHRLMRNGDYFLKTDDCRIAWMQHEASTVRSNILSHYHQCSRVHDRIVAVLADLELPGQSNEPPALKHLAYRIIGTAVTAVIAGERETSELIIGDLHHAIVADCSANELAGSIRFSMLRYLCRPEREWPDVWEQTHKPVTAFLEQLAARHPMDGKLFENIVTRLDELADRNEQA